MPPLDPRHRASLPDRAFAYIDSRGKRMLPIHDVAHARNALARFGRVKFEDDASRDRARLRLLNAAKKFKIVPIGFIAGELQSERSLHPRVGGAPRLPSGFVTMMMTDIEGSTALVQLLGDRYLGLTDGVWSILRRNVIAAGAGMRFKSLGTHRLRGLTTDVALFQVAATGLRTTFPSLRG